MGRGRCGRWVVKERWGRWVVRERCGRWGGGVVGGEGVW